MASPVITFDFGYNLRNDLDANNNVVFQQCVASDLLVLTQDPQASFGHVVQVAPTADLQVFAETLIIRGPVKAPGRKMMIYARVLQTEADTQNNAAALIVDAVPGADGDQLPQPKATNGNSGSNGYQPGHDGGAGQTALDNADMNGATGNSGDPGGHPGAITLWVNSLATDASLLLSANGGSGGNGYKGQDGGDGGPGGPGADADSNPSGYDVGTNGGPGGWGGKGGRGGDAGAGSSGGEIQVSYMQAPAAGQIQTSVSGGAAGTPGGGGSGGAGGAGGNPGAGTVWYDQSGHAKQIPGGLHGVAGTSLGPGTTGNTANPGNPGVSLVSASILASVAQQFPTAYLQMLLDRVSAGYLAAGDSFDPDALSEPMTLNGWLTQLAAADGGGDPLRRSVYQQARVLAYRLSNGYDYFGHGAGYAPAGSKDFWESAVNSSLSALTTIEEQYESYFDATQAATVKQQDLENVLASSQARQNDLQGDMSDLVSQLSTCASDIAAFDSQMQAAYTDLQNKLASLSQAVQNACGLTVQNFCSALQSVLFMSGDELQALGGIAVNSASLADTATNDVVGAYGQDISKGYLLQKILSLGQDFQTLSEGYSMLGDYISSSDPNGTKLAYVEEQLDSLFDQIANMQQAAAARTSLDTFVQLANSKNREIYDYNSIVARYLEKATALAQEQAQQTQVQSQISQNADPGLIEYTTYLSAAYNVVRRNCLYDLYMAVRAGQFWSLDSTLTLQSVFGVGNPQEITAATITTNQNVLSQKLDNATEALSQDAQTYNDLTYEINDTSYPQVMQGLRSGQLDRFLIEFDPAMPDTTKAQSIFYSMADVRVDTVRAWADGAKTTDGVCQLRICQLGREQLVSTGGTVMDFKHDPKIVLFRYVLATSTIKIDGVLNQASEDSSYAPIGPFSTWEIYLLQQDNSSLDLTNLKRIRLEFTGTFHSFGVMAARV